MAKADIGLIGLAVMGENLILNMESKGFTVACFNRTVSKVDKFIEGRAKGKNIIGCHSIEELADNLEKPRKIMLMVKAGEAVDAFIDKVLPHLEDGDIIIDGGNSHFPDTMRRAHRVCREQGQALHRYRRLGWRRRRSARPVDYARRLTAGMEARRPHLPGGLRQDR